MPLPLERCLIHWGPGSRHWALGMLQLLLSSQQGTNSTLASHQTHSVAPKGALSRQGARRAFCQLQ